MKTKTNCRSPNLSGQWQHSCIKTEHEILLTLFLPKHIIIHLASLAPPELVLCQALFLGVASGHLMTRKKFR